MLLKIEVVRSAMSVTVSGARPYWPTAFSAVCLHPNPFVRRPLHGRASRLSYSRHICGRDSSYKQARCPCPLPAKNSYKMKTALCQQIKASQDMWHPSQKFFLFIYLHIIFLLQYLQLYSSPVSSSSSEKRRTRRSAIRNPPRAPLGIITPHAVHANGNNPLLLPLKVTL